MKIMFTGGGTLGPVTPLLAIAEAMRQDDTGVEFVWVGTRTGPEREIVEQAGIRFLSLDVPKLNRYAPVRWLTVPPRLIWSLRGALHLIQRERPAAVVTAGAYVSVPLIWMAAFYGIPTWVHQQDVRPGLANRLMAPAATKISVAWQRTLAKFPAGKTMHVGNPVRSSVLGGSKEAAAARFGLDATKPTVLILGGGTGSMWLNKIAGQIVPELVKSMNVLHLTGLGKNSKFQIPNSKFYRSIELLTDGMAEAYAIADLVVCRAGMGTISELAALSKPAVFVPIPDSHQQDNAAAIEELGAGLILDQRRTSPQMLLETIQQLIEDSSDRTKLGQNLHAALPTEGVAQSLASRISIEAQRRASKE